MRACQCRSPLQPRNSAVRIRVQCRSACRTASRTGPGSRLCAGARQSQRLARALRLPHRGRIGQSDRDLIGAGPTLLADQPGRGPVFTRPPCRSRGMLPQGAGDASGLCLRPRQSAVCAQLPHRPHGRSDLCRIPELGPPSREAPRIRSGAIRAGSNARTATAGRICIGGLPTARRRDVCRTVAGRTRSLECRTLSLRGRCGRGCRHRTVPFAQRSLAQHASACATRSWPN